MRASERRWEVLMSSRDRMDRRSLEELALGGSGEGEGLGAFILGGEEGEGDSEVGEEEE